MSCVLCIVLSLKQSGVLECHLSHISKDENYELCILAGFLVTFITTGKKISSRLSGGLCCVSVFNSDGK